MMLKMVKSRQTKRRRRLSGRRVSLKDGFKTFSNFSLSVRNVIREKNGIMWEKCFTKRGEVISDQF